MRAYLESSVLRQLVVEFFAREKPVAAICHGVLLAARRTRFWDPHYYRTYLEGPGQPAGYMSVQQEVTRALSRPGDFLDVPPGEPEYGRKTNGRARDSATDARAAWVVRDRNYISARWPGDVHTFARALSDIR